MKSKPKIYTANSKGKIKYPKKIVVGGGFVKYVDKEWLKLSWSDRLLINIRRILNGKGIYKVNSQGLKVKYPKIKIEEVFQKTIGRFICWLIGHPQGGNMYIVGEDTYCPRCGRMNLS